MGSPNPSGRETIDPNLIYETYKRLGTFVGTAKELEINVKTVKKHVRRFREGEQPTALQDNDQKDGQHHLESVMACAAMFYTFQKRGIGEDDRINVELER